MSIASSRRLSGSLRSLLGLAPDSVQSKQITVLTVDTNTELPFAVAGQRFKLIAGRHTQISRVMQRSRVGRACEKRPSKATLDRLVVQHVCLRR